MDWNLTLCEPDIDSREIEAVTKIFNSKWFTMGAVSKEFENDFAQRVNAKYAFAVSNCTAALHIANLALGISSGDQVICPALTFVATANATKYTGADVVFCDSASEQDLSLDCDQLEQLITPNTKAISVVHYAGFPANMERIMSLAEKYKLAVIEDCAHSPLAKYRFENQSEKFLGTIGDIGCFSFFSNKNMTTGEGGMITTNSDELAEKIRLLRSHGMTTLTYDRHKGHSNSYDVLMLGYNYRIDEIRSAFGLVQLSKLDENNKKRRELFKLYCEVLSENDNIIVPYKNSNIDVATPHIMSIMIKSDYFEIKQRLFEAKIQTSKHYDLIPSFTLYKDDQFKSKIKHIHQLLTLPLYPAMTINHIQMISQILKG